MIKSFYLASILISFFTFKETKSTVETCQANGVTYQKGEAYVSGEWGCTICVCSGDFSKDCHTITNCSDDLCQTNSRLAITCCEKKRCKSIIC